ncbi:hypothetical protein [Ramlibacter montanisoli]|uniref:Periplasmic heavy metal sensor n=1 Tax=Ramlibacter montanisoli TaxID=2732512 RepID=A0A849KBZ0_9BURK|nr:hypothetical protein [Ramlibacter montanisoli]NNU42291.1 hypothetical protein [Ramlibacter montanisoli]
MRSNLTLLGALVVVGLGACSAYGPGSMMQEYGMGPGMTPGMPRSLHAAPGSTMLALGPLPASLSAQQRAQVDAIAHDLRRETMERTTEARRRVDAVLTAEQREEWRRAQAPR